MPYRNVNTHRRSRNLRRRGLGLSALATLLIVAGCSTTPPASDSRSASATTRKPSKSASTIPVLPAAGSGRGGYYKDDGPGDDIPEGLENVADAVPTIEPYSRTGNKPYIVFGKTYAPLTDDRPFRQRGMGTWYGKKFHKHRTSSGEMYDMYKMSAAHPTLPIPSYARVTNLRNGKQVIVRINDRGPFHSTRIIDLSYTAALKLGYLGSGSGELEVERLLPADILAMNKQAKNTATSTIGSPSAAVAANAVTDSAMPESTLFHDDPLNQLSGGTETSVVEGLRDTVAQGYYVQLGAFSQQSNAEAARQRLLQQVPGLESSLDNVAVGGIYRLYAGPFASRSAAEDMALQVRQRTAVEAILVQR